jgi:hypothetical protein
MQHFLLSFSQEKRRPHLKTLRVHPSRDYEIFKSGRFYFFLWDKATGEHYLETGTHSDLPEILDFLKTAFSKLKIPLTKAELVAPDYAIKEMLELKVQWGEIKDGSIHAAGRALAKLVGGMTPTEMEFSHWKHRQ